MKGNHSAPADRHLEAFLAGVADVPPAGRSLEKLHVAAAAAEAVRAPVIAAPPRGARVRQALVPRRIPTMSLSALTALFAGIPAKVAAASVVAVASAGGLVATDTLPEPAQEALARATGNPGFSVPVGPPDGLPPEDGDEEAVADEANDEVDAENAGQGEERSAEARAAAEQRKEDALDHAQEASSGAEGNNADGLNRARDGGANSGGAEDGAAASQAEERQEDAAAKKDEARGRAGGAGTDHRPDTTETDDTESTETDDDDDTEDGDAGAADQRGDDARANAPGGRPTSD